MTKPAGYVAFEQQGSVGTIRLCRPEKLNALCAEMHTRLRDVLRECTDLAQEGELRALVVTGEGRAFCAGADLNERRRAPGEPPPDLGRSVRENFNALVLAVTQLPVPVIAAVNGPAAGAGFGLALACDLLLVARSATFVASFSRVGLVADCGVGWFLSRLVGAARARSLVMLAETTGAEQAVRIGIANRLVEDSQLQSAAQELAQKVAAGPTRGYALEKRSLRGVWDRTLPQQLEFEAELQQHAGISADYREGVAAFLDCRPPVFTGR